MKSRIGLGIDRVYEVGEILDVPRYFLGGFANPQPCNPRVRIVRFDTTRRGSAVDQHGIQALTHKMQELGRRGVPARAKEEHKTRNCNFIT